MTLPTYQQLMLPMLILIRDGHQTIPSCLGHLREQFGLTDEEFEALLPSGKQTVLANRAAWARNYMSQAGLVKAIKRGAYELTTEGKALLDRNPNDLTAADLKAYPNFIEFLERSKQPKRSLKDTSEDSTTASEDETPESTIAEAFSRVDAILREELLDAVLGLSPTRFEALIVELLIGMGYGGGEADMGARIGKSGDGGIDGVVNEDALGLDAVYIQAKRYAPENKVGRPAIQGFVGSMTGESATKGVFVTTSDFSREARDYISRVQQRVVLINGSTLARLMIAHDVGVRTRDTFIIKAVDGDYFSED